MVFWGVPGKTGWSVWLLDELVRAMRNRSGSHPRFGIGGTGRTNVSLNGLMDVSKSLPKLAWLRMSCSSSSSTSSWIVLRGLEEPSPTSAGGGKFLFVGEESMVKKGRAQVGKGMNLFHSPTAKDLSPAINFTSS